jgi:hypothetical protein
LGKAEGRNPAFAPCDAKHHWLLPLAGAGRRQ